MVKLKLIMSLAGWLMAVSLFIIILLLAVGLGWWLRNKNATSPNPPTSKYTPPLGWGVPTVGPDPNKNVCQVYQFPTQSITINGVTTALPPSPTFNPEILNGLTGTTTLPLCLDSDQMLAQQFQRQCTAPAGVSDGQLTRCLLMSGGTTGLGGTENFFATISPTGIQGCPNLPPCPGQLATVSINFHPPQLVNCMVNNGASQPVTMSSCNPGQTNQVFRVTRANPNQNPVTLNPYAAQNGLIGQIYDRQTNSCLLPGPTISAGGNTGTTGPTGSTGLQFLTFGPCDSIKPTSDGVGPQYPGYVWAFLPSATFSVATGITITTPPQIAYVGDVDISQIPLNGYGGLTGLAGTILWMIDNKIQAINSPTSAPYLDNLAIAIPPNGSTYTAQYLNLATFNTISQEPACIAEANVGSCISL